MCDEKTRYSLGKGMDCHTMSPCSRFCCLLEADIPLMDWWSLCYTESWPWWRASRRWLPPGRLRIILGLLRAFCMATVLISNLTAKFSTSFPCTRLPFQRILNKAIPSSTIVDPLNKDASSKGRRIRYTVSSMQWQSDSPEVWLPGFMPSTLCYTMKSVLMEWRGGDLRRW